MGFKLTATKRGFLVKVPIKESLGENSESPGKMDVSIVPRKGEWILQRKVPNEEIYQVLYFKAAKHHLGVNQWQHHIICQTTTDTTDFQAVKPRSSPQTDGSS